MAGERRASRAGVAAVWAGCIALAAAAPVVGGVGTLASSAGAHPTALDEAWSDAWGNLMAAPRPPSSAPRPRPERPEVVVPAGGRVVQGDLLNAPVPALCGHPAGRLEKGLLPGLESGVVWVFTTGTGDIPEGRVAYGSLDDGPDVGAAVAVYCDQGGVAWPESVVLYGPGPEYRGHVTLSDLAPGRQRVEGISIADGTVTVRFTDTYAPDESGSRGRVDGTVDIRVDDGQLVVAQPEFVDERPTAEEAVRAAGAADTESLGEVATSDAATELIRLVGERRAAVSGPNPTPAPPATPGTHVLPPGELGVGECSGPLAGAPVGARATCTLVGADGVVAHMHLNRLRFAVWQVVEVALPPSEIVAG